MVAIVAEELESGERKDLLTLRIGTFGLDLCGRTWDTTIDVFLESISVLLMQVRYWCFISKTFFVCMFFNLFWSSKEKGIFISLWKFGFKLV